MPAHAALDGSCTLGCSHGHQDMERVDMINEILRSVITAIWILSILCAAVGIYQLAMTFLSFRRLPTAEPVAPKHRFTVLVPARNESMVIGPLIDSLKRLNYPRDLFNILVIPNNCTDNTEEVALAHGAQVLNCMVPIRTKGQALSYVFDHLPNNLRADAYCVFDADNVVDPDFLLHMNRTLGEGYQVAQGYRDSKNPYDTIISSCTSIYYMMNNRFYCHPRRIAGISAALNGTAFMVSDALLRRLGGWQTHTLTEDIEFTLQSIIAGEKVAWVPEALTYDEQPMTFEQSWKQRKRWSIGVLQCVSSYMKPLLRQWLAAPGKVLADAIMLCFGVLAQYLGFYLSLAGLLLRLLVLQWPLFPLTPLYDMFYLTLALFVVGSIVSALQVSLMERKLKPGLLKGVFMYWFFLASWIPINIVALLTFRNNQSWEPIRHTRAIHFQDLPAATRK